MATDFRGAVRTALAAHLRAQLTPAYSEIAVSEGWPTPGKPLPALALTITLPTSAAVEVAPHTPHVWQVTPIAGSDPPQGKCLYSWGLASIGLQLDLWAGFPAVRDEVASAVSDALQMSPDSTIASPPTKRLARASSLLLRVPGVFGAVCEFNFSPFPDTPEASDNAQRAEWRATWQGTATLYLLAEQTVSLRTSIVAQLATNGGSAEDVPLS